MKETTRLFLALIISMGAIFLWNHFYVNPKLEAQKKVLEAQKLTNIAPQVPSIPAKTADVKPLAEAETISKLSREEIIKSEKAQRVVIKTDELHGSINLKGGIFDDITLAKYRETLDEKSPEVALLSPRNSSALYFLNLGWVSNDVKTPDDSSLWRVESGKVLTPTTPVVLKFDNGAGQVFRKNISIDDKQLITVKLSVENKSAKAVTLAPYGLINRSRGKPSDSHMGISREGLVAVTDGILNEAKYENLVEDGKQEFTNVSGWAAIDDKYWLSAIIPQNSGAEKFNINFKSYKKDNIDRFQADILAGGQSVAPQAAAEYTFNVFAGAKKLDLIEEYAAKLNIDMFDHAIDFGWFYFMTKPIFQTLTFFHKYFGNMGISILLLTVCVRLILFPIANKSYGSMARMKKHMPEITKLKDRYKGDRQKQGMEMMKYYKEHKINPASGCLPVLIQIPVFFSLYKVLYISIEMRHAAGFLWIKDLSAIDPTNIFTLFGLAMWNVPAFLPSIGVLPIIYAITMWLQQKLSPPAGDESQRIVMAWMPWIFLFVFAGFASGLVLYWIWNNCLSILQQYIITRKVEEDKTQ